MTDDAPEAPAQPAISSAPAEQIPSQENVVPQGALTAPANGRRGSLRDIRRQLTEEELKQTGVQKLVIEDFERAEMECDALRAYVEKFHEADKCVGIMTEKLKVDKGLEIITGVGLIGGGAIFSLAPSFWAVNTFQGVAALGIGTLFVGGSILAKVVQRSK
jgi:hypothetical protein